MTARKIYEKETGNKCPSNQIAYCEWHIEYVKWLENKISLLDCCRDYIRSRHLSADFDNFIENYFKK